MALLQNIILSFGVPCTKLTAAASPVLPFPKISSSSAISQASERAHAASCSVAAAGGRTWQTAAPVATSLNSTRALPWVFQTRGRSREIVADICPWEVEDAESSGPMPTKQCFDFRVLLKSQAVSPPLCRSEREKPAR